MQKKMSWGIRPSRHFHSQPKNRLWFQLAATKSGGIFIFTHFLSISVWTPFNCFIVHNCCVTWSERTFTYPIFFARTQDEHPEYQCDYTDFIFHVLLILIHRFHTVFVNTLIVQISQLWKSQALHYFLILLYYSPVFHGDSLEQKNSHRWMTVV